MLKLTAPLLVILLTAIFLFLAATNIQGGWLYLVDALLWAIVALALILPVLQLRKLHIKRIFPGIIYQQQKLHIEIQLSAPKFWRLMFINVKDLAPEHILDPQRIEIEDKNGFVDSLSGHETFSYTYAFTPPQPGVYLFKKIQTGSFGPLGLLGIYRHQNLLSTLVVRPLKPQYSLNILNSEQEMALQSARQRTHHSEDISHLREYHPGDNRRSIHWKNTAKRQKLIVAEAREEPFQNALVLINTYQSQRHFKDMIHTSEKVCDALLEQNLELSCWAQAGEESYWNEMDLTPPQRFLQGIRDWDALSYWLATLMPDSSEHFYAGLKHHQINLQNQLLVIISDQLEPQIIEWLTQIHNNMNHMPIFIYTNHRDLPDDIHRIARVEKLLGKSQEPQTS